ncbi:dTDP-4-dehydrorhamnose reductase [Martelella lutilitoris]|uniref:dTDP-4-dehydrorhamnose reductase n=1 Tax=Martelella lutilitoris TaxID=2583532 RepID=A0A7T7KLF4_9HYPH|nr:dTDP-4-dehydrorhamnose reductase [Martelella lutilitoris]QQM30483.1 dTDP-4-dehydrorhamnose reductase [Martelella lutilitoris]
MILVFGSTGQVARELRGILPDARFLSREEADLSDPAACGEAIRRLAPEAVINAAAYTAVDKAESEEDIALRINGEAPGAMARACAELGIPLVHISTDYVFDGTGETPFATDRQPAPLSAYGRTKLAGERAIAEAGPSHAVLRTSWVFSAHGSNFVKTMLRLSETRDALNVVRDQIGGPTSARAIAAACKTIAEQLITEPGKSGIYHFSGAPDVSWAEFARAIFAAAGKAVVVNDIPTSDYPTPAARPLNSRLDCAALSAFGLRRPDWNEDMNAVLETLGAKR